MGENTEKKTVKDYIKLDSFLKKCGACGTGGQAKLLIQNSNVKVNGETETRRGRKLYQGDEVETGGKKYVVQ